jgi:hypothetical protein
MPSPPPPRGVRAAADPGAGAGTGTGTAEDASACAAALASPAWSAVPGEHGDARDDDDVDVEDEADDDCCDIADWFKPGVVAVKDIDDSDEPVAAAGAGVDGSVVCGAASAIPPRISSPLITRAGIRACRDEVLL